MLRIFFHFKLLLLWTLLQCAFPGSLQAAEKIKLVIGGAGPSTAMTAVLAEEFCKLHPEYEITVPPRSIKHRGGLQWVTERGQVLGRLGRPLGPKDRAEFPTAIALPFAFVKVGFAVPKSLGVSKISLEQWRGIYSGDITNWSQLGGLDAPIVRLGRHPSESVFRTIVYSYPDFRKASFVTVLDKDDQMIRAIKRTPGAIGFSDLLALGKHPNLQILEIESFDCLLEVGLVYDKSCMAYPVIQLVKEFVASSYWRDLLMESPQTSPPDAWQEKLSPRMVKIINGRIRAVEKMAATPILIRSVKNHNSQQIALADIEVIDEQWIQGEQIEFAQSLQNNPAGKYLSKMVKGNPMIYTEAFVCGNQGAVVGEYPRTSDYWQGDERKFTNCFRGGAGGLYVGKMEFDESTQSVTIQLSVPVMDDQEPIGVLVVGIRDIENLAERSVN